MEAMEELAAVFKIFGDYTRLTILSLLMDHEELCVGEIAERLNMTQSGVSHQLALLKQSKLSGQSATAKVSIIQLLTSMFLPLSVLAWSMCWKSRKFIVRKRRI